MAFGTGVEYVADKWPHSLMTPNSLALHPSLSQSESSTSSKALLENASS